jgi:hypothetical protein
MRSQGAGLRGGERHDRDSTSRPVRHVARVTPLVTVTISVVAMPERASAAAPDARGVAVAVDLTPATDEPRH